MKCQLHQETIVDLARGVPVPAAVADAVQAHTLECAHCRADLARERELSAGLQALADSMETVELPAGLEARLLDAFDAQQRSLAEARMRSTDAEAGAGAAVSQAPRPRRAYGRALAAAAAVALVSGLAIAQLETMADRPAPPAEPPQLRPESAVNVSLTTAVIALSEELSRQPERSLPPRVDRETTIVFQTIPDANALPALESGRIMRTELPVTALPAYGVEIVPDVVRRVVIADLLVGQDGRARAIRLVPGTRQ